MAVDLQAIIDKEVKKPVYASATWADEARKRAELAAQVTQVSKPAKPDPKPKTAVERERAKLRAEGTAGTQGAAPAPNGASEAQEGVKTSGRSEEADVPTQSAQKISVDRIKAVALEVFQEVGPKDYKESDFTSYSRARKHARPRQAVMYLVKRLTGLSLPQIGKKFGNRDHTTVMHGVRKIDELRMAKNPDVDIWLQKICQKLGVEVPAVQPPQ